AADDEVQPRSTDRYGRNIDRTDGGAAVHAADSQRELGDGERLSGDVECAAGHCQVQRNSHAEVHGNLVDVDRVGKTGHALGIAPDEHPVVHVPGVADTGIDVTGIADAGVEVAGVE